MVACLIFYYKYLLHEYLPSKMGKCCHIGPLSAILLLYSQFLALYLVNNRCSDNCWMDGDVLVDMSSRHSICDFSLK